MNAAHLHLTSNHLPLIGLGFAIVLNLISVFMKSTEVKKLATWFYILTGASSLLAILSGDGAGEIIRSYPGISNDMIEYHETWGYFFFFGLIVVGCLSAAALWYSRREPGRLQKFQVAALIAALLVTVFAFQAGSTGGEIRHPEIEQGMISK